MIGVWLTLAAGNLQWLSSPLQARNKSSTVMSPRIEQRDRKSVDSASSGIRANLEEDGRGIIHYHMDSYGIIWYHLDKLRASMIYHSVTIYHPSECSDWIRRCQMRLSCGRACLPLATAWHRLSSLNFCQSSIRRPGLRQGRGGAWDHRRCGTCFVTAMAFTLSKVVLATSACLCLSGLPSFKGLICLHIALSC